MVDGEFLSRHTIGRTVIHVQRYTRLPKYDRLLIPIPVAIMEAKHMRDGVGTTTLDMAIFFTLFSKIGAVTSKLG